MISIESLLQRPEMKLWRASSCALKTSSLATGYGALDAALHLRGWPSHGVAEVLFSHPGAGELSVFLPALAALTQQRSGTVFFIGVPYLPFLPALAAQGVDVRSCWVVQPDTFKASLWAAEHALAEPSSLAVIFWAWRHSLSVNDIRRLQFSAQKGQTLGILMRHAEPAKNASPVALRLLIQSHQQGMSLHILKQPGGWGGQKLLLPRALARLSTQPPHLWPVPHAMSHQPIYDSLQINRRIYDNEERPYVRFNA